LIGDAEGGCGAGEEELDLIVAPSQGATSEQAAGEEVGGREGGFARTMGREAGDRRETESEFGG